MKKIQIVLLVIIVVGLALLATQKYWVEPFANFIVNQSGQGVSKNDPWNLTYTLKGEPITLVDGILQREVAPGSASKETIRIFGEPVYVDLDQDGDEDAVAYLTQDFGGSGTFFYLVAAIRDKDKYKGTNAMLLGDRIAPQNINWHDGRAVANFAERKPGEPMTAQPSVGKSVWVHYDKKSGEIGEWVKDFEGESVTIDKIDFEETGHFVKDNPGMKRGVWFLVYEKPGAPALSAELLFDGRSVCMMGTTAGACPDVLLPSSALTRVQGVWQNDVVRVIRATSGN